jgi:hypothetical protein
MSGSNSADDSGSVNPSGLMPPIWVKLAMLLLNLMVWLSVALRLAGELHPLDLFLP